MANIVRPETPFQERVIMTFEVSENANDGTQSEELWAPARPFVVDRVSYLSRGGLPESDTNHALVGVVYGLATVASHSTEETAGDGSIPDGELFDLELDTTVLLPGEVLEYVSDETGTTTVPAARVTIEGRYV